MPNKKIGVEIHIVEKRSMKAVNTFLFVIGMVMVWQLTHNAWALFWTWVASIDAVVSTRSKLGEQPRS